MMKLRTLPLDELTREELDRGDVFIPIPFLYEPCLLELKKYNAPFNKMVLQVDGKVFDRNEILTSLCRLFGTPLEIFSSSESCNFAYANSTIEIAFSTDGERLSGVQIGDKETLRFSSSEPYIKRDPHFEDNPVIVLPEGDGRFYMELDKKESEGENRVSIIGNPQELFSLYNRLKDHLSG